MTGRTSFSTLRDRMTPEARTRAHEASLGLERQMALAELRRARHLSQQELGAILQINQASVAKMERRADMYVGTLRRFIEAMGGELEIFARFPEQSIRIDQFSGDVPYNGSKPGSE
jgi:DNA-binding transcriptional regulator YiaG